MKESVLGYGGTDGEDGRGEEDRKRGDCPGNDRSQRVQGTLKKVVCVSVECQVHRGVEGGQEGKVGEDPVMEECLQCQVL